MTTETTGAPAAAVTSTPAAASTPAESTPATELVIGDPAATETPSTDAPVVEEADKPGAVVSYEKTGDVGLDMALGFVGKLGFGPSDPAMKAAIAGDFTLLKAKLGELGAKAQGYEGYIALAEKSFSETKAKSDARAAKDVAAIHQLAGGKEQWEAVSKWAGTKAEPEERTQVNAALKQGGMVAKAMAAYLIGLYGRDSGVPQDPATVVAPDAAGKAGKPAPLTAQAYATEVQALRAKMGSAMEKSPQYAQLQQRRMQAKQAGI